MFLRRQRGLKSLLHCLQFVDSVTGGRPDSIGSPLGGSCAGRWDSIKRGWPDHCSVIWLDSRLGGNRWLRTGVGEAQGVCESVIGYRR